jgi:hypothetical protein
MKLMIHLESNKNIDLKKNINVNFKYNLKIILNIFNLIIDSNNYLIHKNYKKQKNKKIYF